MSPRRAFTLIEVITAIALAGIIALSVRGLYGGLSHARSQVTNRSRAVNRHANAERLLRSLVLSVDAANGRVLNGSEESVSFAAWCMTSRDELALRRVRLLLSDAGAARSLIIVMDGIDSIAAMDVHSAAELRYLGQSDSELWLTSWQSPLALPRAIAILSPRDTIIFRIGDRG